MKLLWTRKKEEFDGTGTIPLVFDDIDTVNAGKCRGATKGNYERCTFNFEPMENQYVLFILRLLFGSYRIQIKK